VKVEQISHEEAKRELETKRNPSKYKQLFQQVRTSKTPIRISGLTRGQVAALYRAAKLSGITVRANYKELYCVLIP
jgi:hypothetical protein